MHQAFELAHADAQTLGRLPLAHTARHGFANQKRAVPLHARLIDRTPRDHLPPITAETKRGHSGLWTGMTFLLGANMSGYQLRIPGLA